MNGFLYVFHCLHYGVRHDRYSEKTVNQNSQKGGLWMEEHDNSLVLTLKVVAAYVVWILLILEAVGVIPSSTTDGRYMCGIISFVLAYIFVPPLFQIVALGITALFHQKQR